MSQELKRDAGKLRMDLVPPEWFVSDAQVLTFGQNKGYKEHSWQQVPINRYKAALLRHLFAYLQGEIMDEESGLPHLAMVRVNAGFLLYFSNRDVEFFVADLEEQQVLNIGNKKQECNGKPEACDLADKSVWWL